MDKAFRDLLRRAELPGGEVHFHHEFAKWPEGMLHGLIGAGVVEMLEPAGSIEYEGCEERCHIPNTATVAHSTKRNRRVCLHRCIHGCGLLQLDPRVFGRCRLSVVGLARAVAKAVAAKGSVLEDVPGRIVLIGTVAASTRTAHLFLAIGLSRDDATDVVNRAERLKASHDPVVLTLSQVPPRRLWPAGLAPAVGTLLEHATLRGASLLLELEPLLGIESIPHPRANSKGWITVTEAGKLLMKDRPGLTLGQARARVSQAAGSVKNFRTNKKKRADRRIEAVSFDAWRLKQRDADLDAEHDQDEEPATDQPHAQSARPVRHRQTW